MKNNLLRTKADVFHFLFEEKGTILYNAQEAEDLGNHEGAAELRAIADQIGAVTKRLAKEMEEKENE